METPTAATIEASISDFEYAEKNNAGYGNSSSLTGERVWQSTQLVDVLEKTMESFQTNFEKIHERMSVLEEAVRKLINVNERLRGMVHDHLENGKEPQDGIVSASLESGGGYHLVLVNGANMDKLPIGSEKIFTDEILKAVCGSCSYKSTSPVIVKVYLDWIIPGDYGSSRYFGFKNKVEKVFGFNDQKADFKVFFPFPGEPKNSVIRQVIFGLEDSSCRQIIVLGLKLSDLKTAVAKTFKMALSGRGTPEQLITVALEQPYYHWAKDVAAAGYGILFLNSEHYLKDVSCGC